MNEWVEDLWMEANCSDGPDPGPTDGPVRIIFYELFIDSTNNFFSNIELNANNN